MCLHVTSVKLYLVATDDACWFTASLL